MQLHPGSISTGPPAVSLFSGRPADRSLRIQGHMAAGKRTEDTKKIPRSCNNLGDFLECKSLLNDTEPRAVSPRNSRSNHCLLGARYLPILALFPYPHFGEPAHLLSRDTGGIAIDLLSDPTMPSAHCFTNPHVMPGIAYTLPGPIRPLPPQSKQRTTVTTPQRSSLIISEACF